MLRMFRLVLSLLFIAVLSGLHAQTQTQTQTIPQGISYQSVARNGAGQIIANKNIALRTTIHDGGPTGASLYTERHTVQTNDFGTFGVVIGGGSIILGNFNNINWGSADKYLQVELDSMAGTNYTDLGASRLNSVPYTLTTNASAGNITTLKYDTAGILNLQTRGGNTISTATGLWLTGGNSNLNITNNYLGTINNVNLIIQRGGKEGMQLTSGAALLATGDTATGVTPASGAGKRMMWIPAKGAFRAGSVTGSCWDNSNIGYGSSGIGNDAFATGVGSVAIGNFARATGTNTAAIGTGVIAKAANSMVVGSYNDTTASGTGSGASDVLFQVGNGLSALGRSNAMTVNRSGKVTATELIANTMSLQDTTIGSLLSPLTGAVTVPVTKSFIKFQTLGLPGSVVVTLGSGSEIGQMVVVEAQSSGLPILQYGIKLNDSGNLKLNSNAQLLDNDTLTLVWDNTNHWVEVGRSSNHN